MTSSISSSNFSIKLNFYYLNSTDIQTEAVNGTQDSSIQLCAKSELIYGSQLVTRQFLALLLKRLHYARRTWGILFCQIFFPLAIVFIAIGSQKLILEQQFLNQTLPSLDLNLETLYGPNTEAFYYGGSTFKQAYAGVNADKYHAKVFYPNDNITSGKNIRYVCKKCFRNRK